MPDFQNMFLDLRERLCLGAYLRLKRFSDFFGSVWTICPCCMAEIEVRDLRRCEFEHRCCDNCIHILEEVDVCENCYQQMIAEAKEISNA